MWAKQYSLAEIVDPSNFKSYEELKSKLGMVLQGASKVPNASTVAAQTGDIEDDLFVSNQQSETKVVSNGSDNDDDAMSYFAKLADDS